MDYLFLIARVEISAIKRGSKIFIFLIDLCQSDKVLEQADDAIISSDREVISIKAGLILEPIIELLSSHRRH